MSYKKKLSLWGLWGRQHSISTIILLLLPCLVTTKAQNLHQTICLSILFSSDTRISTCLEVPYLNLLLSTMSTGREGQRTPCILNNRLLKFRFKILFICPKLWRSCFFFLGGGGGEDRAGLKGEKFLQGCVFLQ